MARASHRHLGPASGPPAGAGPLIPETDMTFIVGVVVVSLMGLVGWLVSWVNVTYGEGPAILTLLGIAIFWCVAVFVVALATVESYPLPSRLRDYLKPGYRNI